ncbi:MAG: hypothetical protein QOD77_238 [Thermoplasmata archaeon]|jgi:hypothetical protein|nr:hypothetical protein [Thermoplasmata archaeon]
MTASRATTERMHVLGEAHWPPGTAGTHRGVVLLRVRGPRDAKRLLRLLEAGAAERPANPAARTERHLALLRHAGLLGA